jgi:hypothetical protein
MKYVIPAAIAIGVGLVVLLSYLVPNPVLLTARLALVNWAVVLAGLAVLSGAINLFLVHGRRIQAGDRGWIYSLVTILAALGMLVVGVLEGFNEETPALYREATLTGVLYEGIVVASLATLASLAVVFLVVAAVRMMRTRASIWSILFLAVVIVALVGWLPFNALRPLNRFREWLMAVPVSAGARGILIGVALGTLVIGLRVLTGVERPYKD